MTSYGPDCPQQVSKFVPPEGLDPQTSQFLAALASNNQGSESEDCTYFHPSCFSDLDPRTLGLTLNVIKPANANPKAKLPVVVVSYISVTQLRYTYG